MHLTVAILSSDVLVKSVWGGGGGPLPTIFFTEQFLLMISLVNVVKIPLH